MPSALGIDEAIVHGTDVFYRRRFELGGGEDVDTSTEDVATSMSTRTSYWGVLFTGTPA